MSGILESIDADEVWVVAASNVRDGVSLNHLSPVGVPPEGSQVAVPTSSMEAGVSAGNAEGLLWDEISYRARLGDCVLQKGMFDETDVKNGVAVNEVL